MQEAIVEVRAFVQNQVAERTKAEATANAEAWTKYAALSMALIAIVAGYTMSKSGDCAGRANKDLSEATYNQTHASDQWSFYQAKAQKQLINQLELNLQLQSKVAQSTPIDDLKDKIARYDKEKQEIQAEARKFEKVRDEFRSDAETMTVLSAKLGRSAQAFQISLAIGGLCLLSKKRWMWWGTLGVAAYALILLVMALLAS